jgi:TRAP-type C4-dicarboxylate transport system permease large subunit
VIFRGILPFFLAMVVCLVLLILAPQIALFLPGTMSR